MASDRLDPRLVALLDDACWLIYRLFGVSARPRLRRIDPRDASWESMHPWICHFAHTGEAWQPAEPAHRRDAERPVCRLAASRDTPAGLPPRGTCVTGLSWLSVPLDLGRGAEGSLVLGPFLSHPPTERGFRALCVRLKIPRWAHMRWAYMQSPVLSPAREGPLLEFCRSVFGLVRQRYAVLLRGGTWEDATRSGPDAPESAYPALRLAEDLPIRIYGVFVNYRELGAEEARPVRIDTCALEYVDGGRCRTTVNDRALDLGHGQMVLLLPGDRVAMAPAPGLDRCELITITFVATASLLAPFAGTAHTLDAFQLTLLSRMTDLAAALGDSAHRSSEMKLMLAQLILGTREPPAPARIVQPVASARARAAHSPTVREILRYLEDTVEERIRFPELARRFRMSTPTLRRIFRAEVGMSPRAYRQQQVITRAKLLLHRGNLSVTEVARRLGFCSVAYFSHAFTKAAKVNPREYAKSLQPTVRQIEQARVLLQAGDLAPAEIATRMGFTSVHSFAQAFKQQVGISPTKYPGTAGPAAGPPPRRCREGKP